MGRTRRNVFESLENRRLLTTQAIEITTTPEFRGVGIQTELGQIDGRTLFAGVGYGYGDELMVVEDGQVSLVKDILPERRGSGIYGGFQLPNDVILFGSSEGAWRTDGTAMGTTKIAAATSSSPINFTIFGDNVYFNAGRTVWRTNIEATQAADALSPGSSTSEMSILGVVGNRILFTDEAATGTVTIRYNDGVDLTAPTVVPQVFNRIDEIGQFSDGRLLLHVSMGDALSLWVTDGTSDGTLELLSDMATTVFRQIGDTIYFAHETEESGRELWKTNGTVDGTTLVRDIRVGALSSSPGTATGRSQVFGVSDNQLLFVADDGIHGVELWASDGTSEGTRLVRDIVPGPESSEPFLNITFTRIEDTRVRFFQGNFREPTNQWTSDGTEEGTVSFESLLPDDGSVELMNDPREYGGIWYFGVRIDQFGWELWKTDWTPEGTGPVIESRQEYRPNAPVPRAFFEGKMYYAFQRRDGDVEIWRTDGTALGTELVPFLPFSSFLAKWIVVGDKLFISDNPRDEEPQMWVTDGTEQGTSSVELPREEPLSNLVPRITIGDYLYFTANAAPWGNEIWRQNVYTSEVSLVEDVAVGANSSGAYAFQEIQDKLYFLRNRFTTRTEIWQSDGTPTGTFNRASIDRVVGDVASFGTSMFYVTRPRVAGDPYRIWQRDLSTNTATEWGTLDSFRANSFQIAEGRLYMLIIDGSGEAQIWTFDGSQASSIPVGSYGTGFSRFLGAVGNLGIYEARIGTDFATAVTDGTTDGTKILSNADPTAFLLEPNAVNFGPNLYYSAYQPSTGTELWRSDGTTDGTTLAVDLLPGVRASIPAPLSVVDDRLLLIDYSTYQLSSTDGTAAGTQAYYQTPFTGNLRKSTFNGKALLSGLLPGGGYDILVSDGTTAGTSHPEFLTSTPFDDGATRPQFTNPQPNYAVFEWNDRLFRLSDAIPPEPEPPQIDAFRATPESVLAGDAVTLAVNASDADGNVTYVQFFRDANVDGTIDVSDEFLGEGIPTEATWTLETVTTDWPLGHNQILAVAEDSDGRTSSAAIAEVELLLCDVVQIHPTSVRNIQGNPQGSLDNLKDGDDSYFSITEVSNGTTRLENIFTFDLPAGSAATLVVEAFHDSDDELFYVNVSSDNRNWRRVLNITQPTDDDGLQTYPLPSNSEGPFYVKVRDSRGDDVQPSTISLDRLYVEVAKNKVEPDLPFVSIQTATNSIEENSNSPALFEISRSGSLSDPLEVAYMTTGEAANGEDYATLSGVVTIPANASSVTVEFQPIDDTLDESDETASLSLIATDRYHLDVNTTTQITIVDDDDGSSLQRILPLEQRTRRGTLESGDFSDLANDDGQAQILSESASESDTQSIRLIHEWRFEVPESASSAEVVVEAFHESSDEVFWANYSTDGISFRNMMTFRSGSSDAQRFTLPDTVAGSNVWIKLIDSGNSDDALPNQVAVDQLFIETNGPADDPDPPATPEYSAVSESTVLGTVVDGSDFTNTFESDDVYELLEEDATRNILDHRWSFTVPEGKKATFVMEAFHNATNEVFWVNYSTDGIFWRNMLTLRAQSDTDAMQSFQLPEGTAGDVFVKIRDSLGAGDDIASQVAIDRLAILTE